MEAIGVVPPNWNLALHTSILRNTAYLRVIEHAHSPNVYIWSLCERPQGHLQQLSTVEEERWVFVCQQLSLTTERGRRNEPSLFWLYYDQLLACCDVFASPCDAGIRSLDLLAIQSLNSSSHHVSTIQGCRWTVIYTEVVPFLSYVDTCPGNALIEPDSPSYLLGVGG